MAKKKYKTLEDLNREFALMQGKPFSEIIKKNDELYSYAKTCKLFPGRDLMESLVNKIRIKKILNGLNNNK